MRKQDLQITISPTGQVTWTVKGVKGSDCLNETKFLEEAMGGAVLEQEKTSEYWEEGQGGYLGQYTGDGKAGSGGEGGDE
jgi:hypothetical protein